MVKHFHKVGLISIIASLFLAGTVYAATPANFSAMYVISDNKPISHRNLTLKLQGNRYTLSAKTEAVGLLAVLNPGAIIEQSQGRIDKGVVVPSHYMRSNPNNKKKNLDLSFDWKKSEILSKTSPTDITYKISAHTHDMLSETLSVMVKPPMGSSKLDIATRSRPKFYVLKRIGEETIRTAAGEFKTVKYQRTRNGKKDRIVYIWCAPKLDNLPVKIQKQKKGKVHTAELNSYKRL